MVYRVLHNGKHVGTAGVVLSKEFKYLGATFAAWVVDQIYGLHNSFVPIADSIMGLFIAIVRQDNERT
jgi:hypothetical protein